MNGLDAVIGQERAINLLLRMLESNRLPHALLFSGIEGIGKGMAARALALSLNCSASDGSVPCMSCRSCKQLSSGNHPDVVTISPSGRFIKLDQVRALRKDVRFAPLEGLCRVIIIRDVHLMNVEASNAILKLLEEPPGNTYFILTCLQVSDLVPTIVSRCQLIPFNPLPAVTIAEELMGRRELEADTAMAIALLAKGSIGKALSCDAATWMDWRRDCLGLFASLAGKPMHQILAVAETLAKQKAKVQEVLDLFLLWVRDLLVYKFEKERVINADWLAEISDGAAEFSVEDLLEIISAVFSAQQSVLRNANPRLVLEVLLLRQASLRRRIVSSPAGRLPFLA